MIIDYAHLPPAVQAWVATLPFEDGIYLTKTKEGLVLQEPPFRFDLERMKRAIKGCESKEEALKNGTPVPESALVDFESFNQWLTERKASKGQV